MGNRVCNIFECCFILPKHNKWGLGVAFSNSEHRLVLGHVNDMRCLEKVHVFCLFDLILYIPSTIFQI